METSDQLSLREALSVDTIRIKETATSWEQAVELVGRIMLDANLIESNYIEAMKNTIRELGPYSVIAPGIAMPHARPEDGALQTGFALTTLDTPVEFGSKENDPVDILIAFSALDKDSHIQALKEISWYLGNDDFIRLLREAQTVEQVFEALQDSSNPTS